MKLSEIYIRDPFILPYEGAYYLYGKTQEDALEFLVYKSRDLIEWSQPKVVFTPPVGFWATKDFWAPEVHVYKGKFYMFASFYSEECLRGTQILVSDSPDGSFCTITECAQTPKEWNCLDGTLYVDAEGNPYMVFCHEWTQINNGTICYAKLSEDFTHFETKPKKMFAAGDYDFVIPIDKEGKCFVTDGPFFYRTKSRELLLLWSSIGTEGYFISVLKSDNGEIDGRWLSQPILFNRNGGHGMLFETFEGELKLILHTPNDIKGEEHGVIYNVEEKEGTLVIKERGTYESKK